MATQFANKATASAVVDGVTVNFESNIATAELLDNSLVTLVKTASPNLVVSGGKLSYTVVITNLSLFPISNFNFADVIPTGLTYATGTFKVNTVAENPVIAGQNLSYVFTNLPVGLTTVTFECDVL